VRRDADSTMLYPEDVTRINSLAGVVDRWVLGRWRARRRPRPPRRATRFSDDAGRPTSDVIDHAARSGTVGLHTALQATAAPPRSGGSGPAVSASYRRWCDECARVTDAYRDWADSDASEEAGAWVAYEVALDRAETAYILYVQAERARSEP
jgi:hypothetical protein